MKYLIIIITLVFATNTLKAQLQGQALIDSLLKELPKMKEDTNAVILLQQLSYEFSLSNPDKGIKYGMLGVKLAEDINWKKGKAKCYNILGIVYSSGKSDFVIALEYYHKALKIYEELGDKKTVAGTVHNIGNIYGSQSDYPKALEYFLKALKINEKPGGNKTWLANNFGAIGNIYSSQSDYPKALEYYHKALKILEGIGNKSGVATALVSIGSIYVNQSNYPKAEEYFHKSLKIFEELGENFGIAINLGNLGNLYIELLDFTKALEYYHKVLKIEEEIGNKLGIAISLGNIGEIYLNLSQGSVLSNISEGTELVSLNKEINLNRSIEYTLQAIDLLKENGILHEQSYYLNNLSSAYREKGDYKKALKYYKESKELKDSIFSSENQTKIANLEAKRENELKEKEIVILKKEKENQKLQRYAMFGGIAGLGIIIGLILIQRRKSEKLLLNVLPATIAQRLKAKEHPIADYFDGASIIFIDIVGFTSLSSDADPKRIVSVLNDIFTIFDKLADTYGLEKIKTIGDSYMAVCGIPEINTQHAKQTALMALEIKRIMTGFTTADGTEIHFRIGIDCGAVVAGVIGEKKFIYDLWSDAVNTASRMESTGESGQIQITENFKTELEKFDGNWNFTLRGEFEIKGKGLMKTYFLEN